MLRPRVSVGDQVTILIAAVKIAAWILSLVAVIIVAVFRFGAASSRRCWATAGSASEGRGSEDYK